MNGCTAISFATVIENNETPDVEAGATMELNCNNEKLLKDLTLRMVFGKKQIHLVNF